MEPPMMSVMKCRISPEHSNPFSRTYIHLYQLGTVGTLPIASAQLPLTPSLGELTMRLVTIDTVRLP
jgi:hypothetical protein